ncbi:unnamed protein product, partial [Iphiclides podalirius]
MNSITAVRISDLIAIHEARDAAGRPHLATGYRYSVGKTILACITPRSHDADVTVLSALRTMSADGSTTDINGLLNDTESDLTGLSHVGKFITFTIP